MSADEIKVGTLLAGRVTSDTISGITSNDSVYSASVDDAVVTSVPAYAGGYSAWDYGGVIAASTNGDILSGSLQIGNNGVQDDAYTGQLVLQSSPDNSSWSDVGGTTISESLSSGTAGNSITKLWNYSSTTAGTYYRVGVRGQEDASSGGSKSVYFVGTCKIHALISRAIVK